MTRLQIDRMNALETQRANRAKEFEMNRSNLANEDIKRKQHAEDVRHNKKQELISGFQVGTSMVNSALSAGGKVAAAAIKLL